jgi:hypothetical protein
MESKQLPPLKQGLEEHSLMLVWQRGPENPASQRHEKELSESTQVPLFRQGLEAHSLMLV